MRARHRIRVRYAFLALIAALTAGRATPVRGQQPANIPTSAATSGEATAANPSSTGGGVSASAPPEAGAGRPALSLVVDGDIVSLLAGSELNKYLDRQDAIEVSAARSKMYEAMVEVQDGLYEEAIPKLEWVIDQDPTLLGAWETLGWAYWLTNRRKDAENLWNRLVNIAPNEPMGYNLLAQVATRDGDFDRAEELYLKSLRLNPDQFETRLNLSRVLLWGGKQERAVALLKRLHREDPERLDVEIDLAWSLYANEEYEEAIVHWNRINDMVPDNPAFLLARANVSILIGDVEQAEKDARRVVQIDPRNVAALNMIASISAQVRDPVDVVTALRRVQQMTDDKPTQASIALRIAAFKKSVIDRGGKQFTLAEVLRDIRESLDLDDTKVGTHLYYGEVLTINKQYSEAERVFKDVLERFNPHSLRARFGLVETYFGRMMLSDAEQQLRENFRAFNPNNPFRHVYWARLHFARGDIVAAMESLDRLEQEGSQGAVFCLLYHGINPSEFSDMPSMRQLREHLSTLRRAGFRFITPSELPAYFKSKQPTYPEVERPWLNRLFEALRYAWTGQKPEKKHALRDYTPDKIVMVTFDDGLRNSFRYGTQVAQDLGVRMTMFVGVGDALSREQRYVATFREIKDFVDTGVWEIQSHMLEAGNLVPLDAEGKTLALPVPNRIWIPDRKRLETLREYQARLRREFRDSRHILIRELGLEPDDVAAVAYPYGEVGQEDSTNIREFDVPSAVLNEAEVSYRMGFIQFRFGYTMKTDDPMLYKRYEPDRRATGRDVLREAYRSHPVFLARRMRAEMAALSGQLHLAQENYELLRRDGYPEEDLAELNAYILRYLARIAPVPEVPSEAGADDQRERTSFRKPYVGASIMINRANEVIDDQEFMLEAGMNVTRRTGIRAHVGFGRIEQAITSNVFVEAERVSRSTSIVTERRVENGVVTDAVIERTSFSSVTILSNELQTTSYSADKTFFGVGFSHVHQDGSYSIGELRAYTVDGEDIEDSGSAVLTYGVEHQWRPVLTLDVAARYYHGLVPSARSLIEYDSLLVRPYWRVRDGWDASALGYFAYFEDKNSYLRAHIENFWRLSRAYDIWFGLHNSLETMDRDSDLYYSPYWEQRHYVSLRFRRSYPNFFAMLRLNLGYHRGDVRREELDRFLNAKARGEQEGWSPGAGPDQGWKRLLGFDASLTRRHPSGFEYGGNFSVNSTAEYIEHTISLNAKFTF